MTPTSTGRVLLREWLTRSRLRQCDLADQLDITEPYLSQVLSGYRRPKLELLITIERLTGVPIESWADTLVSDLDRDATTPLDGTDFLRVK
jgi:transcriptional regulator with XRE-family HTH domain